MIKDLAKQGFKISLWQLSYFNPKNRLFKEILDKGLPSPTARVNLPPRTPRWISVIPKPSNGTRANWPGLSNWAWEPLRWTSARPRRLKGVYHSGKTGFVEHNYYPLRYNKAAADITKHVTGENIIWARSAWAGSQRYPLHWGGDAKTASGECLPALRGGLSLGLCGFSFWSHDIGGFVQGPSLELYRRWTPFGAYVAYPLSRNASPGTLGLRQILRG